MWILFAFGSAIFAGLTAVLAKVGIKGVDSRLATALRTIVVFVFAWSIVFLAGTQNTIKQIDLRSLLFLIFSGLTTGASWLFYFAAIKIGVVNQVAIVDKTSTILTMLLAFLLLGEKITPFNLLGILLISVGTYLMLEKKENQVQTRSKSHRWLIYAVLSAVFAAFTAILGKIGIDNVDSNLGVAIRTGVVLAMAWGIVFVFQKQKEMMAISKQGWIFTGLSGLATGLSWLCYYKALQNGPASVVVPIDKLGIVVTVLFAYFVLHEKLTQKALLGLLILVAGTLTLLIRI